MKKIISVALATVMMLFGLVGLGAPASATPDHDDKFAVSQSGVSLLNGDTFPAHGHVNVRISTVDGGERSQNLHFDPNNGHPGGVYIGKSFYPVNLAPGECIIWVQVHQYNYHFDATKFGNESPVCAPPKNSEPPRPEQPQAETRTKVTDVCKAATRVTDHYITEYVWSDSAMAWVLGKEKWSHKVSTPLSASECGYETVVREKVTIDCKPGGKNFVITDNYKREWSFDAKSKQWVLGKEIWVGKSKVPATNTQCPPPVEPTPEPTDPESTEPPTDEPTDPGSPEPTDPPTTTPPTEEPTEEPTEPPVVTPEPSEPPVTEEPLPPYQNCEEAFRDGALPISADHPRWSPRLDGDKDGISCESYIEEPSEEPPATEIPAATPTPVATPETPVRNAQRKAAPAPAVDTKVERAQAPVAELARTGADVSSIGIGALIVLAVGALLFGASRYGKRRQD